MKSTTQKQMFSRSTQGVFLVFILLIFANVLNGQVKVKPCGQFIYLDAIKREMSFKSTLGTVTIKEGEAYYLKVLLKSCKGAMYFERHLVSNDNIVLGYCSGLGCGPNNWKAQPSDS